MIKAGSYHSDLYNLFEFLRSQRKSAKIIEYVGEEWHVVSSSGKVVGKGHRWNEVGKTE